MDWVKEICRYATMFPEYLHDWGTFVGLGDLWGKYWLSMSDGSLWCISQTFGLENESSWMHGVLVMVNDGRDQDLCSEGQGQNQQVLGRHSKPFTPCP